MDINWLLYLGVFAICMLIISVIFLPKKKQTTAAKTTLPPKKSYRGVSISPCANSCAQAIDYQQRRFLPDEAPNLPLPLCDKHCTCTYKHHQDRRAEIDRRALSIQMENVKGDHREKKGRRHTDMFAH